jgi:hypothetical protein
MVIDPLADWRLSSTSGESGGGQVMTVEATGPKTVRPSWYFSRTWDSDGVKSM